MGHMTGEKLLEEALLKEYGRKLAFEPRAKGEHGKPFLHYSRKFIITSAIPESMWSVFLQARKWGLIFRNTENWIMKKGLQKLVPVSLLHEILESDHIKEAFYNQWVLREAYMKWTGEGFSRDPRTIPMDRGNSVLLEMEPGYSGAVWSENPLELRWEHLEISIP